MNFVGTGRSTRMGKKKSSCHIRQVGILPQMLCPLVRYDLHKSVWRRNVKVWVLDDAYSKTSSHAHVCPPHGWLESQSNCCESQHVNREYLYIPGNTTPAMVYQYQFQLCYLRPRSFRCVIEPSKASWSCVGSAGPGAVAKWIEPTAPVALSDTAWPLPPWPDGMRSLRNTIIELA